MVVQTEGMVVGEPQMGRERWLQLRRFGIGSSDAPAVCGVSKYKSAYDVWLDKTKGPDHKDRDTIERRLGRLCEAGLAEIYAEEIGREVLPPPAMLLRHSKWSFVLASLDRITVVDGKPRVLEIKTVWADDRNREWGDFGTDEVPMSYLVQVQQQLAVTGWQGADLVAMFPGNQMGVYEIPRNDMLIQSMLEMEHTFWKKVQEGPPPEFDWDSPKAGDRMRRMYQEVREGTEVTLDEEAAGLAAECVAASALASQTKKTADHLRLRLAALMKEAEFARLPNGYTVTRKLVKKRQYTVEAHDEVHLKVRPPALSKEAC